MTDANQWRFVLHYLPELSGLDSTQAMRFAVCASSAVEFDSLREARANTPADLLGRFQVFCEKVQPDIPPLNVERVMHLLYDENDARNGPLFAGDTVALTDGEQLTVDADTDGDRVRLKDAAGVLFSASRTDLRRMPSLREPRTPKSWCDDHGSLRFVLLGWTEDGIDDVPVTVDDTIRMLHQRGLVPLDRCGTANGPTKDFYGALMRRKRACLMGVPA